MRKTLSALAAILLLMGCGSKTAPAPAPVPKGKFTATYTAPKNADHREVYKLFKEDRILDDFADSLNSYLALPHNITLTSAECGEANAFYDPENNTITLCYELMADLVEQAESLELDEEESENFIAGSMIFILLHEIGHALTHVLDLPITGREEDAVDQLAAVLLMDGAEDDEEFAENADLMSNAALWFDNTETTDFDSEDFADEHSLDEQRYYNLMCWIYGADPEAGADIIEDELLPEARAERCEAEYAQISKAWTRLLEPHERK